MIATYDTEEWKNYIFENLKEIRYTENEREAHKPLFNLCKIYYKD